MNSFHLHKDQVFDWKICGVRNNFHEYSIGEECENNHNSNDNNEI